MCEIATLEQNITSLKDEVQHLQSRERVCKISIEKLKTIRDLLSEVI